MVKGNWFLFIMVCNVCMVIVLVLVFVVVILVVFVVFSWVEGLYYCDDCMLVFVGFDGEVCGIFILFVGVFDLG